MGCVNSSRRKVSKKPLPQPPSNGGNETTYLSRSGTSNSSHSNGSAHTKVDRKPSMNNTPKQKVVIALYSYEGRDEGDLGFEKGEKLIVLDDKEPDWWLAKRLQTEEKGYIPMNFVVTNIIETEEYLLILFSNSLFLISV
jgi:hypothetical protein